MAYDVGRVRQAALAVYNAAPGPASALVLVRAAMRAMQGLQERRADVSALIAFEGAKQWDKDAQRYNAWLVQAEVTAQQILHANQLGQPPSTIWADRYGKMLSELFTGGARAGVVQWAVLSNTLDALDQAQRDVDEQTGFFLKWWAGPIAELAAQIAIEYPSVKESADKIVPAAKKVGEQAAKAIARATIGLGMIAAVVGVVWAWPWIAPVLFGAASSKRRSE